MTEAVHLDLLELKGPEDKDVNADEPDVLGVSKGRDAEIRLHDLLCKTRLPAQRCCK